MGSESSPILSFCVPVFGTQRYLTFCLESIKKEVANFSERLPRFIQEREWDETDFAKLGNLLSLVDLASPLFELIIVDDGTPDKSDKKLFSQIISKYKKDFLKNYSTGIKIVEHSRNLGLVEARRSAVLIARGKWCVFVDSDDEMTGDALLNLMCAAYLFDADIVSARSEVVCDFEKSDETEQMGYTDENIKRMERQCYKVHEGILENDAIIKDFILDTGHSSFLWGKLFETSLLQASFPEIPQCYCVMSEDFLIYFFILMHAKRYYGIEHTVYKYFIGRGVSSNKEITSLESWNRACTSGTVFMIIFDYLAEFSPTRVDDSIRDRLQAIASQQAISNVKHFSRVIPSLQEDAHALLVEYWGEEIIEQAEAWLEKQKK